MVSCYATVLSKARTAGRHLNRYAASLRSCLTELPAPFAVAVHRFNTKTNEFSSYNSLFNGQPNSSSYDGISGGIMILIFLSVRGNNYSLKFRPSPRYTMHDCLTKRPYGERLLRCENALEINTSKHVLIRQFCGVRSIALRTTKARCRFTFKPPSHAGNPRQLNKWVGSSCVL